MKIELKIELLNTQLWDVDWNNKSTAEEELQQLSDDIKQAIIEYVGVSFDNIKIESKTSL